MFGGEVCCGFQFWQSLSVAAVLIYVYGEDFEHDPLPQMPPLKLNVAVDKEWKGFYFRPEIEWSAVQNRISEKFNENTTPEYALFHMKISKEFDIGTNR